MAQSGLLNIPQYTLHSDLAQFCLPAANRDANRKLAYVNSVCFLFLAIGGLGFKQPKIEQREPPPLQAIMPVEFVPEQQQPKEPEPQPEQPQEQPDTQMETPQIATVVAADVSQVRFAVPVEGPVVFAPAKFAQAPPANPPKATNSKIIKFTGTDGGTYPQTEYPTWALRQDQPLEATATLIITVKPNGSVQSVEIQTSSGSVRLVKYMADFIIKNYQFPPTDDTELRRFEKPIEFKHNR